MTQDIDKSLATGMVWTAGMRWLSQLVSWVAIIYAARLLTPGDFGLIAMASFAVGLARLVDDFGLDAILVQDRSLEGNKIDQLAGLAVLVAVSLVVVLWLLSPLVSLLFNEPSVAKIVMVLSVVLVFDSLQVVPRALLQRQLRYDRLAWLHLIQTVATSLALVIAVSAGMGYWSLVINTLVGALVVAIVAFYWVPFRFRIPRDIKWLAKPMLQGWRILMSRVAYYGYTRSDEAIVGRLLGKELLGAFSFATTFSSIALQEVASIVTRVVPGIFSEVQTQIPELRRYFLLLTKLIASVTFPMLIGLAMVADLFVEIFLGSQWTNVIIPLRLMCIYSAFVASQLLVAHVLLWTGQMRVLMWCSFIPTVVMPISIWLAASYGLEGIGWAWILVYPVTNVPGFYFAFKTLEINLWHWLAALWPSMVSLVAMMVIVLVVRTSMPSGVSQWIEFSASVLAGMLVYPVVYWLFFRHHAVELFSLFRRVIA